MPHLHLYNNVLIINLLSDQLYNIIANDCGGIKMCIPVSQNKIRIFILELYPIVFSSVQNVCGSWWYSTGI